MRQSGAEVIQAQARPRFFFEIAAAGFLTLCAIIFAAKATRPAAPSVKVSHQAAPLTPVVAARDDQAVADFMERFALSRLAAPLPEKFVVADGGSGVGAAVAQSRPAPSPAKEKARSVAFKPQAAPQPPRREIERQAEPVYVAQRIESPPSRKIPVISFIAEKLPNGRDIGNAMASVGKRVGSLFTRG